MHTRSLELKDAPFMLEWMHDEDVTGFLQNNFGDMLLADCERFISGCEDDRENLHLAICDAQDEYLGTVSLKHIDYKNKNAEYAISTRSKAHGTGAAAIGTAAILEKAFCDLELERVYLNVIDENVRANKFYQKMGFHFEGCFKDHLYIKEKFWNLNWYGITREDYFKSKEK